MKQTFWRPMAVCLTAIGSGGFVLLVWPYAIEQSKTQIADWLASPEWMMNTSVILTVEVALQMAFCLLSVHVAHVSSVKKRMRLAWRILHWFPGALMLPVLFFALTQVIFALPGLSFRWVAWGFAAIVLTVIPLGRRLLKKWVPETDLRLELFFLLNALIAVLGIVATVNGRTAVEGVGTVNREALLGCIGIFVGGSVAGWLLYWYKKRKINFKKNRI